MERVYHPWDKWECYPAGFWNTTCPNGMKEKEGIQVYSEFLSDLDQFESALQGVLRDWPNSCEHNLTNENMNRIAWLGQASVCYAQQIPSHCRSGFSKIPEDKQAAANIMALKYLNIWLNDNGYDQIDDESAKMKTKQPKF
jgi:hypothetical protein